MVVNQKTSECAVTAPRLIQQCFKITLGLILGFWISSASMADDFAEQELAAAWQNRDMQTINAARAIGWNFGAFLTGTIQANREACHSVAISTLNMSECENTATETWDEVLNSEYQFLMTQVEDKEGLRELQRAWIKYRDLQCSWTGHWLGSAGSIATAACFGDMTSQRSLEIISANSCFMVEGCLW